jgi:hypothetical protein
MPLGVVNAIGISQLRQRGATRAQCEHTLSDKLLTHFG